MRVSLGGSGPAGTLGEQGALLGRGAGTFGEGGVTMQGANAEELDAARMAAQNSVDTATSWDYSA